MSSQATSHTTGADDNQMNQSLAMTSTTDHTTSSAASDHDDDNDVTATTVQERMAKVVAAGCISLEPKFGVLTVVSTPGVPKALTLFPMESCSCPDLNGFYYTVAAKTSIGLLERMSKPTVILMGLRKNKNKKAD